MKDIDRLAEYFRDRAYGFANRKTKGAIAEFLDSLNYSLWYSERQVRILIEKLRKTKDMAIVSNSTQAGYFLLNPDDPKSVEQAWIMVGDNRNRMKAIRETNAPVENALRGDRPIVLDKEWIKRDIKRDIESAEQYNKNGWQT